MSFETPGESRQSRPMTGFWTLAEIEHSAHQPPTNSKNFDKWTRQYLKSGPGGQLIFLSVNRVRAGSTTDVPAIVAKPKTAAAVSVLSILKSNEFREAYHQALNLADKTPEAQQATARKIIEGYFRLEEIAPNTPLNSDSFYFTEKPIEVAGNYKFLVPGNLKRELIVGTLFLLTLKSASVDRLVEAKEFDGAVSAVEAVRLTLVPERVNGIVSFVSDAKKFYANNDSSAPRKQLGPL